MHPSCNDYDVQKSKYVYAFKLFLTYHALSTRTELFNQLTHSLLKSISEELYTFLMGKLLYEDFRYL